MEIQNISPCKEDINLPKKKNPLKETKILQALQNSIITNLKFQHKPKILISTYCVHTLNTKNKKISFDLNSLKHFHQRIKTGSLNVKPVLIRYNFQKLDPICDIVPGPNK
jgi:hypothetical protein